MRTIRLLIAYDGTGYHGWQLQPDAPTIQGEIERRLATIHNRPVTLHGAGRTDAGVHAEGMVAHFHTEKQLAADAFANSLNSMLPGSIRILEASEEDSAFHARFSAIGKTYIYKLCCARIMMPGYRLYRVHVKTPLYFAEMDKCCALITGTHDFAAFETAGSRDPLRPGDRGSIRTITEARIVRESPDFFSFSLSGDGFLRHMVRNIVGTVLEVGRHRRSVDSFRHALLSTRRSEAGCTAPAHGLMLKKIDYGPETRP